MMEASNAHPTQRYLIDPERKLRHLVQNARTFSMYAVERESHGFFPFLVFGNGDVLGRRLLIQIEEMIQQNEVLAEAKQKIKASPLGGSFGYTTAMVLTPYLPRFGWLVLLRV